MKKMHETMVTRDQSFFLRDAILYSVYSFKLFLEKRISILLQTNSVINISFLILLKFFDLR